MLQRECAGGEGERRAIEISRQADLSSVLSTKACGALRPVQLIAHVSAEIAVKSDRPESSITIPKRTCKILILLGVFRTLFLGIDSASY
jgi:hypothetical protein